MSAENYRENYEKYGDVMFIDLIDTPAEALIETIELGEHVGFPGQIVVRFNAETGDVYGFVIERYSALERKLKRQKAIESAKQALKQLLQRVIEALQEACPQMHVHLQPA